MTDTRLLQLQARFLEGEQLTGLELLELEQARRRDDPIARLLQEDEQLHEELQALHRIDTTQNDFVQRCFSATGTGMTAEKVQGVIGEEIVAAPVLIAALRLELGEGAGRLRRNREPRQPYSDRQFLGWLSAAAAIMVIAIGTWWWSTRSANLPATVAKTDNTPANPSNAETGTEPSKNALVESAVENSVEPKSVTEEPHATEIVEVTPDRETFVPDPPDEPGTDLSRLASLQFSPESIWGQKPAEFGSFPAKYGLQSGIAELVLADGTRLLFQGPANFTMESPRQMRVEDGQIRIEPVAAEESFSVATPTVWLNGRDNLLVYLNVRPIEGTKVQVEKGELTARPWVNDGGSEMLLSKNELDRGLFGPAWNEDSTQPATAIAVNDAGKFKGVVNAADRPISITSPAVFARILDESRAMIREDGQKFPDQWRGMVDGLEEAVANMDLQFDNQSIQPGTAGEMLDQFERIREQMLSGMDGAEGNKTNGINQSSAFSGVLNVNGREQRFSSPEEFQAAQNSMLGSMAGQMMFGTSGDLLGKLPPGQSNTFPGNLSQSNNLPGNSNSSSSFSGMINSNGQSMQFTLPEEFNRAMQQFKRR